MKLMKFSAALDDRYIYSSSIQGDDDHHNTHFRLWLNSPILALNCLLQPGHRKSGLCVESGVAAPYFLLARFSVANDNKDIINNRIISARRAMYSLMGAGLHGLNGVGLEVSMVQYNTCALPTRLYGLEALHLNHSEVEELSEFHRKNICCLQHLPKSTAIPAIHLLSGSLPIEVYLPVYILNTFCAIIASTPETPPALFLKNIIIRQLAMKETISYSWTMQVKIMLSRYKLPPASELLASQLTKHQWNALIKFNTYQNWTEQLQEEAKQMSSLCFTNIDAFKISSMHPVWLNLHNKLDIRKAHVGAKLLMKDTPCQDPTLLEKRGL